MKASKMSDGVYRIGANIQNGDLFEGIWPIPEGVSLNSYVVRGEKTALIDLVRDWDGAPGAIEEQLKSIDLKFEDIDYLILNHLEPDHTGWMNEFCEKNPNAEIIATKRGIDMLNHFFTAPNNTRIAEDGDTLDLGNGQVLTFFHAPNVHWPETMVTWQEKEGILFACDAFGSYGCVSDAVFDDQISDEQHEFYDRESLRYYANIVAGFSTFVQRAIDKLSGLNIKMIAPSHGIIWRENPGVIVDRYKKFAAYMNGPAEPEITVIYGSMYGNTAAVLKSIVKGIRSEGVPVHIHQVPNEDVSYPLASAWKSAGLVIGMPTYEYKMFPPMAAVIDMFGRKHVWNKKVLRFGSFGWSGGAQKEFDSITEKLKWSFEEPVEWQGAASEEDHQRAYEAGKALAQKVKAEAGA